MHKGGDRNLERSTFNISFICTCDKLMTCIIYVKSNSTVVSSKCTIIMESENDYKEMFLNKNRITFDMAAVGTATLLF